MTGRFDILDDMGQAYTLRATPIADRGLYDSMPADQGGPLANTRITSTMQRHDRKTARRFERLRGDLVAFDFEGERFVGTPRQAEAANPIGVVPNSMGPHVIEQRTWWQRLRGR